MAVERATTLLRSLSGVSSMIFWIFWFFQTSGGRKNDGTAGMNIANWATL